MGRGFAALKGGLAALIYAGATSIASATCTPERIEITTKNAGQNFAVEIADEQREQEIGLMNRPHMASAAGMLFAFDTPKHAQFWMKDTLIPLDMIFADAAGIITQIHPRAVPQDLTPIDGGTGVQFVLEINGGLAQAMGIVAGDRLRHPLIAGSGCALK